MLLGKVNTSTIIIHLCEYSVFSIELPLVMVLPGLPQTSKIETFAATFYVKNVQIRSFF